MSLCKVEWEGEELLLVRGEEVKLLYRGLVGSEALLSFLFSLCERSNAWSVLGAHLVYERLDQDRVALGCEQLLRVAERDVLETVDLTKGPEEGVLIFAYTLNLEDLVQVGVLGDALDDVVEEFGLGERVLVVHG